jgi:hypothetical protein
MQITVDGIRLTADEFETYPSRAQSAVVRALNRGGTAGRTFVSRAIASDTGLKVGVVTKSLRVRQASKNDPVMSVAAGFKRLALMDFGARGPRPSRGRGAGVRVRAGLTDIVVRRDRRWEPVAHRLSSMFIATMPNGKESVFLRAGRSRKPILKVMGPSIGRVFAKYRRAGQARAEEAFRTTLNHELESLTKGTARPDGRLGPRA